METIQNLLPKALQTLGQPMPDAQASIDLVKAKEWLSAGWTMTGSETDKEAELLYDAFHEAAKWLAAWKAGAEPYWLVLFGASGTGKTMLLRRIVEYIRMYGDRVFERTVAAELHASDHARIYSYRQQGSVFVPWRDLVPHGPENQERLERAKTDWVKIVDDLKPQTGAETEVDGQGGVKPRLFEATAAGDLLDARARHWFAVSSNLSRRQFATFWDIRIASRILRDGNVLVDLSEVRDFCLRKEAAR